MSDHCRLCANPLRGSRRKWLFGGSSSLSTIYSHIMGSPVSRTPPGRSPRSHRGKGSPEDSEFLCGKCCHSLNVYHRYDLVMSRMRQLYDHRSTRLLAEKEKLSFTLRSIHARAWGLPLPDYQDHSSNRNRHGYHGFANEHSSADHQLHRRPFSPGYQLLSPGSPFPGQHHGSLGSLSPGTPAKLYHHLLEQDRSMWENESWWEDRSDTCSHCAKGDKCKYCSSWRVSDSNYENVCSAPRRMKHSRDEMDQSSLHRSKSLGSFCGESSRGTVLSFSTSSLERLSFTGEDEMEVFWEPQSPLVNSPSIFPSSKSVLGEALKGLKEITYSPVKTPGQSRIPVRKRDSYEKIIAEARGVRNKGNDTLEQPLGEESEADMDAFMGIEPEVCRSQVSHAQRIQDTIKWLQSQLQANKGDCNHQDQKESFKDQQELIQELLKTLNFKEEVLEDCLTLLLSLPVVSDPSCGDVVTLIQKLREQQKKLKKEPAELEENVHQSKEEIQRLKMELSEREVDLARLSRVLRENQDTITDQLQHCKQRLQAGAEEKNKVREALRLCEAELRAERQRYMCDIQLAHGEMAKLQGTARERDRTTQKLLQEAQSRDHTIKRLQETLSQGGVMRDML
ncbi:hypothetical protein XELAEV_18039166mg [Xenopus laevis]|uniref:Short myomegalin-like EB1 binding protein N-terminal domain-containing protein n=1 Tax=Xenopus laevis TaxID=8355 RepID=A0A974H7W8_XENLA|nr:hypothetical protein XELAEV_18039166mg [Xenopus laevis]